MHNKKKILITLPSLIDPGGVASFYNSLLPHLNNAKYSIATLEIGSTKGRNNPLYPFTDQIRFRRFLKNFRPDLVHINPSLDFKSFIRDGLFIYQAKQKKLPVVVFFRGWLTSFEPVLYKRFFCFFRSTYGKADTFIVLAKEFKKTLQQWGINQPIHIGTTTVDKSLLDNFSFEKKLINLRKVKTIRILFLARLEREKGIFETIDAFSLLLKKGLPVTLSIAGDGAILSELKNYITAKGFAEDQLQFLGYVRGDDKIHAYVKNDIYCFPTYYGEGLPNSVLEAMAFGLPVITRSVAGLADLFIDGEMGFLCQGKTPKEIANNIEKLITNRSLMVKMSEYNHVFAKEHFMAPVVAKNLTDIYSTTLGSTKI